MYFMLIKILIFGSSGLRRVRTFALTRRKAILTYKAQALAGLPKVPISAGLWGQGLRSISLRTPVFLRLVHCVEWSRATAGPEMAMFRLTLIVAALAFLNQPDGGGQTRFPTASVTITSRAHNLLVWNNLDDLGLPIRHLCTKGCRSSAAFSR